MYQYGHIYDQKILMVLVNTPIYNSDDNQYYYLWLFPHDNDSMHYASIEWDSQDIHYQAMSICRTLCAHFQYTSLFPENLASKHWESSSFLNSGWSSLVRSQGQLFSVTQKIKCYKKTQWKWNAMLLKHCYYYYFIFIFFLGGDEEFSTQKLSKNLLLVLLISKVWLCCSPILPCNVFTTSICVS